MVAKNRKMKKERSGVNGILIGLSVGSVILLTGAMIAAYLVLRESLPTESMGIVSIILLFIGALTGNMVSMKYIEKNKLIYSIIFSAAFILLMLVIGMLYFDGISGNAWVSAATVAAAALVSGAVNVIPKRRSKFKNIRSR